MPRKSLSKWILWARPRSDGQLSIVETRDGQCVLSTGEILLVKYEKAQALCEQLCAEMAAITVRTWVGRDGTELVEVHRVESVKPLSGEPGAF